MSDVIVILMTLAFLVGLWQGAASGMLSRQPLTSIFFVATVGSTVVGFIASSSLFDQELNAATLAVFSTFVLSASAIYLLVIRFAAQSESRRYELARPPRLQIALGSIPFVLVASVFLLRGLNSGASYGSPDWRTAVASAATGGQFLIYNSGAILVAAYIGRARGKTWRDLGCIVFLLFLLGAYGGRFVASAGLAVGAYLWWARYSRNVRHLLFFLVPFPIFAFILAGVRYAYSENVGIDQAFFLATVQRQMAGFVFDFDLSHPYVDPRIASHLVGDKLRIALAPFLYPGESAQSFGAYLAEKAGRWYEGGHRVSAIGEAFYFGGIPVIVVYTLICFLFLSRCDVIVRRSSRFHLLGIAGAVVALFSFFIDASFLLTLIYYLIYVSVICVGQSLLLSRSGRHAQGVGHNARVQRYRDIARGD